LALGDLQILLETPQGQRTVKEMGDFADDAERSMDIEREEKAQRTVNMAHHERCGWENTGASCTCVLANEIDALRSRVGELEKENAEAKKSHEDIFHQMEYTLNEQLSDKAIECERLRGALQEISEHYDHDNEPGPFSPRYIAWKMAEIARNALSASEKTTGPGRLNDL